MQEHSFKKLKEEFAFWDKNPNRSTQPDTLKNIFLQLWKIFLFLVLNLNVCLVQQAHWSLKPEQGLVMIVLTHQFSLKSITMLTRLKNLWFFTFELNKRLVQKIVEFVLNLDSQKFWGILGILEEERFIPHSPGNEISLFPVSSFPEEQKQ